MLFIRNIAKICVDILNRNIFRSSAIIRRLTRNKINLKYYADMITMKINRLIHNEFIPNPKEHLYIEVANICNLRCRFCAYKKTLNNNKLIMSNKTFFEIINKATNFGYSNFGLTPIVGEVFLDPNFMEKINFLENHVKVKSYTFFTNFTNVNERVIDELIKTRKIGELFISLYGHDMDVFQKITDSNPEIYKKLILNLKYLLSRSKDIKFRINFGLRTSRSFESLEKCSSELCQIINNFILKINSNIIFLKSFNTWGGFITQEDVRGLDMKINDISDFYKNGACSLLFYKNQVMVDGTVNACACRDVNATLKIGDLKSQEFEEIYSINNRNYIDIIESQQKGNFHLICKNCDFYRSIYKDYLIYHKYKKAPFTIKKFYRYLS